MKSTEPFLDVINVDSSELSLLSDLGVITSGEIKKYLSCALTDAGYTLVGCRLRKASVSSEYQLAYKSYYKSFYDGEPEPGSQERLNEQPFMQYEVMPLCWLLKLRDTTGKSFCGFYYPFSGQHALYVVPIEVVEVKPYSWQIFLKQILRVEKSYSDTTLTYKIWIKAFNCLWNTNFVHQQCLWNR